MILLITIDDKHVETVTNVTRIEEVKQGRAMPRNTIAFYRPNTIEAGAEVREVVQLNHVAEVRLLPQD